jgi:hypothetical protein
MRSAILSGVGTKQKTLQKQLLNLAEGATDFLPSDEDR